MKKVSSNETDIAKILVSKREKSFIDIYKENDFLGTGFLIDKELYVYKYSWKTAFSIKNNGFKVSTELYKSKCQIDYDELEKYLVNELNIIEKSYPDDYSDEEKTMEVIRLKVYENDYANSSLYNEIKEEIEKLLKEDL